MRADYSLRYQFKRKVHNVLGQRIYLAINMLSPALLYLELNVLKFLDSSSCTIS